MRHFWLLSGSVVFFLILATVLEGCGGHGAAGPAISVKLTPDAVSLNRGATAQIAPQALSAANVTVGVPELSYSSDNPAITASPTGLICAGQWDANFVNCRTTDSSNKPLPLVTTANPAHVTATFTINGQTSSTSAVTVTDHERIDSVKVIPVGNAGACVSQNAPPPANTAQFTAQAFSNDANVCGGAPPCQLDPKTIGAVDWSVSPAQVGSILANNATTAAGDAVAVTANTPGQGAVVASIGPSDSAAKGSAPYTTCGVASIHLQRTSGDNGTSISAPVGSTVNLFANVLDSNNVPLSSTVALTWFSSQPSLASVSLGTVGTVAPGFAEITAACLPPSCNVNFVPPQPVFSDDVVTVDVTGTPDSTVLVTTATAPTCAANTACSNSNLIVPIDTASNNTGTALTLPAGVQVNSMVLAPAGTPGFLGTVCAGTGVTGPSGAACSGTLRFDPTVATVSAPAPTIPGRVLATDASRLVIANPPPPAMPTQVFIVPTTGTSIEATLAIPNATAAAFAIDGSKIYIVAGNQLFIYSPTLPLHSISLTGPASTPAAGVLPQQAAFFATGAMAYVADSAGDDVVATCNDAIQTTVPVGHPPGPTHIVPVPNGSGMVDANSPNIDQIDATADSFTHLGICPPVISNSPTSKAFPGAASFSAIQLIVTPDSKLATILTSDQGILVYNLTSKTPMAPVALSGSAKPLSGGVTPDGATLYVAANDSRVHRVDLTKTPPVDAQNIPVNLCPSVPAGCNPDFLVVRPVATAVTLTTLTVTPANPTIAVGAMQQFTATGKFSDNTTRDMTNFVTWVSSNTNVAVIGPTTSGTSPITIPGLAQGLAAGTATISAQSGGVSGSTTLTVK